MRIGMMLSLADLLKTAKNNMDIKSIKEFAEQNKGRKIKDRRYKRKGRVVGYRLKDTGISADKIDVVMIEDDYEDPIPSEIGVFYNVQYNYICFFPQQEIKHKLYTFNIIDHDILLIKEPSPVNPYPHKCSCCGSPARVICSNSSCKKTR